MLNLKQSRFFTVSMDRETSMSKTGVTDCSQVFVTDNFQDVLKIITEF